MKLTITLLMIFGLNFNIMASGDLISKLIEIVDPHEVGRHSDVSVNQTYSLEMVKQFIVEENGYSDIEEASEEYTFVEWHKGPIADQYSLAGTITLKKALEELDEALEYWAFEFAPYDNLSRFEKDEIKKQAKQILVDLKKEGVYFGFDGSAQNSCASPTTFLLVLDVQAELVQGLDLNPCSP